MQETELQLNLPHRKCPNAAEKYLSTMMIRFSNFYASNRVMASWYLPEPVRHDDCVLCEEIASIFLMLPCEVKFSLRQ